MKPAPIECYFASNTESARTKRKKNKEDPIIVFHIVHLSLFVFDIYFV